MSTPERAFFASYTNEMPFVVSTGYPPAASPPAAAAPAASPRAPHHVERLPQAVHYRTDGRHSPPTPPSHRPPAPAAWPKELLQTKSIDVNGATGGDDLQTSCVVVTPVLMPPEPPETATLPGTPPRTAPSPNPMAPPAAAAPPPSRKVERPSPAHNPAPPVPPQALAWKPVWELDEFAWPWEVTQLFHLQTEYFRYAGGKLLDASREGLKILAVAATHEQEGTTTLATCLARAVAAAGARVALFDACLHNPELGTRLGLDFSRGWQDALDEPGSLAESAVYSLQDRITLFPLAVPHRIAALSDPRVSQGLRLGSRHFDLVVVDAGKVPSHRPMFEAGDHCPVSASIIVRDVRRTNEAETLRTAASLKRLGIEAIGIAENFCHPSTARAAAA